MLLGRYNGYCTFSKTRTSLTRYLYLSTVITSQTSTFLTTNSFANVQNTLKWIVMWFVTRIQCKIIHIMPINLFQRIAHIFTKALHSEPWTVYYFISKTKNAYLLNIFKLICPSNIFRLVCLSFLSFSYSVRISFLLQQNIIMPLIKALSCINR